MDPIQQGHRTHLTFSQHWKFFSKKIDKNFRVPQVAFWLHCQGGKWVIWQIGYKLTLVIHIKGKSSALFVTRFDHTFSVRQILNGGKRKELIQSIPIQRQQQDHNSPTPKASEIWNLCWFCFNGGKFQSSGKSNTSPHGSWWRRKRPWKQFIATATSEEKQNIIF